MSDVRLVPFLALSVPLVISACNAPDQPAGRQSFERHCGSCHAEGKLPGTRATGLSDPQKRTALDQFLTRHHAADVEERAEIIEHLAIQEK